MKDLAIEYMPQNPSAGDSLLITVSELETGIPVELLSVVVIGDEFTEFSGLTNYNGQISFTLSEELSLSEPLEECTTQLISQLL